MTKPETEKLPRLFSEWEQRVSDGELCARELWDQVRPHLRAALRAQGGVATPDAAPDAVTEKMVDVACAAALEAGGKGTHNSRRVIRSALEAAIAHARSAGGECG